ncbi:MAG: hypothetical protein JSR26_03375 [Proteobacteria bacterium]|nr:hypothetical protein [Pseudomonadota bacterium]
MVVLAAFISFCSIWFLLTHVSAKWMRRLVGHKGLVDLVLHGTVIFLFLGTSTLGLLQAELAAIMFSISLRVYRYLFGFERLTAHGWERYHGVFKKFV